MAIVNNLIMQLDGTNIVVYPYTVGRAVYINESNGYNLIQALEDLRNNAISDWTNIRNKPFADLSADFKVVDGHLQLNVEFSSDWNSITNKPTYFNTSWSKIAGLPESFPCGWDDIGNKPSYYQAEWNHISNRPENFDTTWNDVKEKPNYFPTNWDMVDNRPEDFASTWNDVKEKPFNTLDKKYLYSNDNILTLNNVFDFINSEQYFNNVLNNNQYYIVLNCDGQYKYKDYNDISNNFNKYTNIESFILPYYRNIQYIYNQATPIENGAVQIYQMIGNQYYYPKDNKLRLNNSIMVPYGSQGYSGHQYVYFYFNQNLDYFTNNFQDTNGNIGLMLKSDFVETARYAFANYNCNNYIFSSYIALDLHNNQQYYNNADVYSHMFDNANIRRYQTIEFKNYVYNIGQTIFNGLFDNYTTNSGLEIKFNNLKLLNESYGYNGILFGFNNVNIQTLEINIGYCTKLSNEYYNKIWIHNICINNSKIDYLRFGSYNLTGQYGIQFNYNLNNTIVGRLVFRNHLRLELTDTLNKALSQNINNIVFYNIDYLGKLNWDEYTSNEAPKDTMVFYFENVREINHNNTYGNWFKNTLNNVLLGFYQVQNITLGGFFINANLNCPNSMNTVQGPVLNLTNTFKNTTCGTDCTAELPVNYRIQYIYLNNAFNNANYITRATIYNNVITATYAFTNCPKLSQVRLPMYRYWDVKSRAVNLAGAFSNCPAITNIDGGGDCNVSTDGKIFDLIALDNCTNLFYNSNILQDVEFNFYVSQPISIRDIFTLGAINVNKKIHILGDSYIDTRIFSNPNDMFLMPNYNDLGYNPNNYTILENGIFYNDYNLYIYNDIKTKSIFYQSFTGPYAYPELPEEYNTWYKINDLGINNIYYNGNSKYNTIDTTNYLCLGAWDITNDINKTKIYYDKRTKDIILTSNTGISITNIYFNSSRPSVSYNNFQTPYFLYQFNFRGDKTNDLSSYFYNCYSLVETLNYNRFLYGVNNINLAYTYTDCHNLKTISYFDNAVRNCYNTFANCRNLEYLNLRPLMFNDVMILSNMFVNCYNLKEYLQFQVNGKYLASNMYSNCYNLKECVIPRNMLNLTDHLTNCYNLESVIIDYDAFNCSTFETDSYGLSYNVCSSCNNLSRVKILCNEPTRLINFGYYNWFGGCTHLLYMPFISSNANIKMGGGYGEINAFNRSSNLVVAHAPNLIHFNRETNNWDGTTGNMTASGLRINGDSYGMYTNNIAIASIGNGYVWSYSVYNSLKNLIMAAAAEKTIQYSFNQSSGVSYVFNNCPNLVFGRFISYNERITSSSYQTYYNCRNLLVTEISDDIRYEWKKLCDGFSGGPLILTESYNDCTNLAYAFIPKLACISYCFQNCTNLRIVEMEIMHSSNAADQMVKRCFNNCHNLEKVYTNKGLKGINGSFDSCYNLREYNFSNLTNGLTDYGGAQIWWSFNNCYNLNVTFDNIFMYNCWCSFDNLSNASYFLFTNMGWGTSSWQQMIYSFNNHGAYTITFNNLNMMSSNLYYSFTNGPRTTDIIMEDSMFMDVNYLFQGNYSNLKNFIVRNCLTGTFSGVLYGWYDSTNAKYISATNLTDLTLEIASNRGPDWMSSSFSGLINLTNFTYIVPENLTRIGTTSIQFNTWMGANWGYNSQRNIKTVKIFVNNDQHQLSISRFENFYSLTDIDFNGNGTIGQYYGGGSLFQNCYNLKNVTGHINFLTGGPWINQFRDCYCIEEPFDEVFKDLPNDSLQYAQNSYTNCRNLKNCSHLNFTLMQYTYDNCANLIHSYCPPTVEVYQGVYKNCSNIQTVDIGPSVTTFYDCYTNCPNVSNNFSINTRKANWSAFIDYRSDVNLDIHIYPDSILYDTTYEFYTNSEKTSPLWNSIYSTNIPERDVSYNMQPQLDEPNLRFYFEQPNIQLNIFYDLEG